MVTVPLSGFQALVELKMRGMEFPIPYRPLRTARRTRFLAGSGLEETGTHPSQEACPEPQNLQVAGPECLSDT